MVILMTERRVVLLQACMRFRSPRSQTMFVISRYANVDDVEQKSGIRRVMDGTCWEGI